MNIMDSSLVIPNMFSWWIAPDGTEYRASVAPLPDPGSIEVVWQLRTLAIAKHPGEFCLRLCEETERDFYHGSPDYDIEALACATLEQVRDAALAVLEAKGGG